MKKTRKLFALLLAVVMMMGLSVTASAQTVSSNRGNASITISNAAKGENYAVYKLFDATVNATTNAIAYTGEIPDSLSDFFVEDSNGYISATMAAGTGDKMSEELQTALTEWVKNATPVATTESDGSRLVFDNLAYGYYVITTSQGEAAITVDSTKPNAEIVDKNSSTPSDLYKTADTEGVSIGETVTYTVTFKTSNYDGQGEMAKKIVSYTIEDTLPDFLSNVTVTSIVVDNDGDPGTTNDRETLTQKQFENKKITLDWYDEENGRFRYDNGATVTITYTAVVNEKVAIDGTEGNKNEVTLTWTDEDGGTHGGDTITSSDTIYSYAIALKKVDDKGNPLAGATFQLPFYVKAQADVDGAYFYAGTTEGEGLTNTLTTPADGLIVIKGVKDGRYAITETEAPQGYNKLTEAFDVTAAKIGNTTTNTTIYLDENGNVTQEVTDIEVEVTIENLAATVKVVVNKTGLELPSTGGMGTTLIYIAGAVLVIGAGVLLVVRRRMNAER